ncbi:MAG: ABC transporter permease [Chloroflexota bacterium]
MNRSMPSPATSNAPRWVKAGLAVLSVLLLIGVWAWAARSYPVSILPSPAETIDALGWLLERDSFYHHLELTLTRAGTGFTAAMFIGVVGGLLIGRFQWLYWFSNPLIAIATTIPPIFWVAIMIIWLGLGSGPPILVIVITATPLVMVNIIQGMQNIPPGLVEMATIFRVGFWNRLLRLYLPAMSGYLFAAALIATRFAWRTVIMAEFVGSSSGLGNRLAWSRQNLETDLAFAYMLVILAFSLMIEYGILRPAQSRFSWMTGHRRGQRLQRKLNTQDSPMPEARRSRSHAA